MKKKITSLFVIVALALGTLALAGCSWFEANSISFVTPPATTYVLSETTDSEGNHLDFVLEVNGEEYSYNEYKDRITVSNFITDTVGTRTAYVEFDGKFKLQFTYTVLDGRYAGGTGSQTDPYLVSTPTQFQHLLNEKKFNYYKLTRNIDFTDFELRMANKGDTATSAEAWTGYIDGSSYSLLNICTVKKENGEYSNKYNEIFGRVGSKENGKFILKDITFNFASEGKSPAPGIALSTGSDAELEFENVKVTGYINVQDCGGSNIAPYVSFINRSADRKVKSISFKNCISSVKLLNSYSAYNVAGFVGSQSNIGDGIVSFANCTFSGTIEGSNGSHTGVGAFVANSKGNINSYSFTGCKVAEAAKLINTSSKCCGVIAIGQNKEGENVENSITGVIVEDTTKFVQQINTFEVTVSDKVVTANYAGAASYKVYSIGTMAYENGSGGAFRCLQFEVNGSSLSKTLYKVVYNGGALPENADSLIQYNNTDGVITYYGKQVCKSLNMASASLMVVAYNSVGQVIGFGTYSPVNLAE